MAKLRLKKKEKEITTKLTKSRGRKATFDKKNLFDIFHSHADEITECNAVVAPKAHIYEKLKRGL